MKTSKRRLIALAACAATAFGVVQATSANAITIILSSGGSGVCNNSPGSPLVGTYGNLKVPAGATCYVGKNTSPLTKTGTIDVTGGFLFVTHAETRSISVIGASMNTYPQGNIENSRIKGSLQVTKVPANAGFIVFHSPGSPAAPGVANGGVTIDGNVQMVSNNGTIALDWAEVGGSVQVNNNKTATALYRPEVAGNDIDGILQCVGNTPAPGDSNVSNVAHLATGQCALPMPG